jgi:hypothetical protein
MNYTMLVQWAGIIMRVLTAIWIRSNVTIGDTKDANLVSIREEK